MKKRNKKNNRMKKLLLAVPLSLAAVVVIYGLVLLVNFVEQYEMPTLIAINEVQLEGDFVYTNRNALQAIVENNISGGYFTLDLEVLRNVLEQQPWIYAVHLRRQWPAGLRVTIYEQQPVAYWNETGFINENGEVFTPEKKLVDLDLPHFFGPDGQHESVWKFMNVLYREMALLDYEIVSLSVDARQAWQLEIAADRAPETVPIKVRLGRYNTDKRLQRFVSILPALADTVHLNHNEIDTIDLRYPNGFAVKKKVSKKTIVTLNEAGQSFDEYEHQSRADNNKAVHGSGV
jgi:cell division protein FtsQ